MGITSFENTKSYDQYFRPIDKTQPIGLACIDDRATSPLEQNLQIPGGPAGLAMDVLATNKYLEYNIGSMAKFLSKDLAKTYDKTAEIKAHLHSECAAEIGMKAIASTIMDRGEEVYDKAQQITGGTLKESTFSDIQQYYRDYFDLNKIYRGYDVEAYEMERHDIYPAIGRYAVKGKHMADTLIVNDSDSVFLTAAAYEDNLPAYSYGRRANVLIGERIKGPIPMDIDRFSDATAIRTGAISLVLPNKAAPGGIGVEIVRRD